ncbi:unnamed protein product [Orchesella dallaii]|uniref:Major facilitator superfamily domain-containing protein 12 n=1 Tax=Orchesella dallaii TaxID=48710 RepID=A0ABP1S7A4_9HEXA
MSGEKEVAIPNGVGGGGEDSFTEHSRKREAEEELSKAQRFIAGGGHILNDLCGALWFSYFMLFMTKVVKMPDSSAAGLLLFGQVTDGIATPIIGYATDKVSGLWPCKRDYGRCKSWHLLGVILVTITFPFIFSPAVGYSLYTDEWSKVSDLNKSIYYGVFIFFFQIGWASTQISHLALIPKLSSDDFVRTEVLAIRYACTVLSNMSAYIIAWIFLTLLGQETPNADECEVGDTNGATFNHIVLASVVLGLLLSILFHFFVVEKPDDFLLKKSPSTISVIQLQPIENGKLMKEEDALKNGDAAAAEALLAPVTSPKKSSKKMNPLDWMKLPHYYAACFLYIATRLATNLSMAYLPLYVQSSLDLSCGAVAFLPLIMYTSGFAVSIIIKPLNKWLGRQLAYTIGGALMLVSSLLIMFYASESQWGIYVIAILLGGGSSAMLVTSLSVTADLIGDNVQSGAFVYGSMSLIDKISSGLMVMLISSLNPCTNVKDGCGDAPEGKTFYRDALGFSSGGFAIVGMICILIIKLLMMRKTRRNKGERLSSPLGIDGGLETDVKSDK